MTIVLLSLHSRTIDMPLLSIISLWISRKYIAIKQHMFVGCLNKVSTDRVLSQCDFNLKSIVI